MTSILPDFIVDRLRRPPPADCHVVPGSTPVLSFGDASKATAATLGLNPSSMEFLDWNGRELGGHLRRFETLGSLGVSNLASASSETLSRVVRVCNAYFSRNPYRRWFDQLQPMLQAVGASYYDGTACHLDLVQWATDPVWGKIQTFGVRERLLADDAGFLRQQLSGGSLKFLLINGSGVSRQLEFVMGITLRKVGRLSDTAPSWYLSTGRLPSGTRVIAWSLNVQSSPGVTNLHRAGLARRVEELGRE